MADLPQPARVLLASVLERASDVAVTVSSVVVPATARLVGGAVDSVRHVADDLGRRLGGDRRHRGAVPFGGVQTVSGGDPLAPPGTATAADPRSADDIAAAYDSTDAATAPPARRPRTRRPVTRPATGRTTRRRSRAAEPAPPLTEPRSAAFGSAAPGSAASGSAAPAVTDAAAGADDSLSPAEAHETASAELAAAQDSGLVPEGGPETSELPISGWDELSVSAIGQRLRRLGADDVTLLLAYEQAHSARPKVLLALERRLARLSGAGGG